MYRLRRKRQFDTGLFELPENIQLQLLAEFAVGPPVRRVIPISDLDDQRRIRKLVEKELSGSM